MNNTDELIENTEATEINTKVTAANTQASVVSGGISKTTAVVTGLLLAATCFVAYINPTFAENQASIIFSGIAGGLFGVATTRR